MLLKTLVIVGGTIIRNLIKSQNIIHHYFSAFGGDTKGDLIAELKLSHTIGGVSKLRSEQVKIQFPKECVFLFSQKMKVEVLSQLPFLRDYKL